MKKYVLIFELFLYALILVVLMANKNKIVLEDSLVREYNIEKALLKQEGLENKSVTTY